MFGLGKYWKMFRVWRKVKPVIDVLSKEGSMERLKSSRLWMTVLFAALGSVMTQMGMDQEAWNSLAIFLGGLLTSYVGGRSYTDGVKMKTEAKKS